MAYHPHTDADRAAMLAAIGVEDIEALFEHLPAELLADAAQFEALGEGDDEIALTAHFAKAAAENRRVAEAASFLGAGSYDHHVPAAVAHLAGRSEFFTAYTPYQAEISQGTLQSIFEYQSQIALLTGLPLANASLYDGASALAEAMLAAVGQTRRTLVACADSLHPRYRAVLDTAVHARGLELIELPSDPVTRQLRVASLEALSAEQRAGLACVLVQSPNIYGVVEDQIAALADFCHAGRTLLAVSWDPIASGLYTRPGEQGADLVSGEGQALGMARASAGGPGLPRHLRGAAAPSAGAPRRPDGGRRGTARLRADDPGARAAHPPRARDQQHLHQPGPDRPARRHLPQPAGARGTARGRAALL